MRLLSDLLFCLRFYSRLPLPVFRFEAAPHAMGDFGRAVRLVPVAGLVIALPAGLVLAGAGAVLAPELAAVLALMALAVTTGALACDQTRITISGGQCSSIPTGIPLTSQRVLAGNFNAAESAFLFGYEIGNTVYEQTQFEASMTGDLFQLPAGGVGTAIGVSYRKDRIDDQPGINERSGNF